MEWKPNPEGGRPQMVEVPDSTEVPAPVSSALQYSLHLACITASILSTLPALCMSASRADLEVPTLMDYPACRHGLSSAAILFVT